MARFVVVLALVLFVSIQAYAADDKTKASAPALDFDDFEDDFAEPPTGNVIGTLDAADSPNGVQAAPLGGPVPPGAYDSTSDASKFQSSIVVAGVVALTSFFYF